MSEGNTSELSSQLDSGKDQPDSNEMTELIMETAQSSLGAAQETNKDHAKEVSTN